MIPSSANSDDPDIIIVGAGPTGLTLACDLARRKIPFRIFEKTTEPFNGSKAKGVQPRTLEVLDDLGVIDQFLSAGAPYSRMKAHVWRFNFKWHMHKRVKRTADTPYPNLLLIPQWRTEEILRDRLESFGHRVEKGAEVIGLNQDHAHVSIQLMHEGRTRSVSAKFLVAADGGRSFVRKSLGMEFPGATSQEGRMIVGDLHVDGLSRDYWHVWPSKKVGRVGLCPLPNTDLFQVMMQLLPSDGDPELTEQAIAKRWLAATGRHDIRLHDPTWLSVFRPNVRMVEKYRVGRVFLAGDAAHVHTPAGAQGLNTGVQDAYNLGWKIGMVLHGAPESLLDTYEEERLPIAAAVLGRSTELFKSGKLKRGDTERQLSLNYRGGFLAQQVGSEQRKLQAGDRAPDVRCGSAGSIRFFDLFRGPHFTLLAFGADAAAAVRDIEWQPAGMLNKYSVQRSCSAGGHGSAGEHGVIVDATGDAHATYGVSAQENVIFLIRPDGYIGLIANQNWKNEVENYQRIVGPSIPVHLNTCA